MEVTIKIDTGEEKVEVEQPKVKKKVRKLKNGTETILELPDRLETADQGSTNILQMLGM